MTWEEIDRERMAFETRHTLRIEAVLLAQGEALARAIEAEDFPLAVFVDRDNMRVALESLWRDVIVRFAEFAAQDLKRHDDRWAEVADDFIRTEGGTLIAAIDETTLDSVRVVLREGLREGWASNRIAKELRDKWGPLSRVRSNRITRTEVIRASNHGSLEGARKTAQDAGLDLEKVWLTAPVTGTDRDRHALYGGLDGQRRKLSESFDVGGHSAMYPGDASLPPSESINCRCTLVYEPAAKSWIDRRNDEIRASYPALRDQMGQYAAMCEIGEERGLSYHTVKDIVYS